MVGQLHLDEPIVRPTWTSKAIADDIAKHVQRVLRTSIPQSRVPERRRERRYPFPYPIHLTPIDPSGRPLVSETIVVIGRHLSEHGLDFLHREPLPYRKVVTSFRDGSSEWTSLVLDLAWCRFTQNGWYENGGRFLHAVPSPLGGAP